MYTKTLELNAAPVASSKVPLDQLLKTHVQDRMIYINGENYLLADVIEHAHESIASSYSENGKVTQFTSRGHFLIPSDTQINGSINVSAYPQHDRLAFIKEKLSFPSKSTDYLFVEGIGYPFNASQGKNPFSDETGHHWSLGLASKSMEHWYLLNLALCGISDIMEMDQPPIPTPLQLFQLEQIVTTEGIIDAQKIGKLHYQLVFASKGGLRFGDALYSMTESEPQSMKGFEEGYPDADLMKLATRSLGLFLILGQVLNLEYYKEGMVCFDLHNIGPHEIFGLTRYPTPFIGDGTTPSQTYGKGVNSSAARFIMDKLHDLERRFSTDRDFSLLREILEVQEMDISQITSTEQAMKMAINPDPNYWPEPITVKHKKKRWKLF